MSTPVSHNSPESVKQRPPERTLGRPADARVMLTRPLLEAAHFVVYGTTDERPTCLCQAPNGGWYSWTIWGLSPVPGRVSLVSQDSGRPAEIAMDRCFLDAETAERLAGLLPRAQEWWRTRHAHQGARDGRSRVVRGCQR